MAAGSLNDDVYVMTRVDDLVEKNRLDLQNQIWLLTLNGNLHQTQLPCATRQILDVGTGTGVWAAAMARSWPQAQVTATDLVPPTRDSSTPHNVRFLESNADIEWPFEQNHFGFIHGRMLTSGIHDWPGFLAKSFRHLAAGGYLELLDVCHPFHSALPEFDSPEASPFIKFGSLAEKSWASSGLDYFASNKHTGRMKTIGFINIRESAVRWPLGEWPTEARDRQIGRLNLSNFSHFMKAAGKAILTNQGFMTDSEAEAVVQAASQDLMENCLQRRYFLTINIHTAEKPMV